MGFDLTSAHYSITPSLRYSSSGLSTKRTPTWWSINRLFLLVHPTKPNGPRTLWKELRELLAFEIASGGQVSIVNRLDRETSGLILVAKTAQAARHFGLLDARASIKERVSRDRLGLAGMG